MIARRRSQLHLAGVSANASPAFQRQSGLPHSIPLFRYAPMRGAFSWRAWNPAAVRFAADLPSYLILGDLDRSTFERSASGWSARWQGTERDTYFDVAYCATTEHYEVRQTWRGVDGGFAFYQARVPLDKVIGQGLNLEFPREWDVRPRRTSNPRIRFPSSTKSAGIAAFSASPMERSGRSSFRWPCATCGPPSRRFGSGSKRRHWPIH